MQLGSTLLGALWLKPPYTWDSGVTTQNIRTNCKQNSMKWSVLNTKENNKYTHNSQSYWKLVNIGIQTYHIKVQLLKWEEWTSCLTSIVLILCWQKSRSSTGLVKVLICYL